MPEFSHGGCAAAATASPPARDAGESASIYVIRSVGLGGGPEGASRFWRLAITPLPRVPVPDLSMVRRRLVSGFPHAGEVIDRVLGGLVGRRFVALRPFLIVGPPGSGKTTLARRLLEELGLPTTVYVCGGVSDASLLGTSARWTTAAPSLPLELIERSGTASPAVLLDEIEKAGTGRANGSLFDALPGFLEPNSASHFWDSYLEATVDVNRLRPSNTKASASMRRAASASLVRDAACRSPAASGSARVIATATPLLRIEKGLANHTRRLLGIPQRVGNRDRWYNSLEGLPPALIDRFRVLSLARPGPGHLDRLASNLLGSLVSEYGLHPAWARPLDGIERKAILEHWPGGSIRGLRSLLEAVVRARDVGVSLQ